MVAEYSVTLENKTKSEVILFIKQLQDMLKEKDKEIEKLKVDNENVWKLNANMSQRHLSDIFRIKKKDKQLDLMAEHINYLSDELVQATGKNELDFCDGNKCCKDSDYSCEECIKRYYERKSEE